ncbi:MAG: hypothetical protein IT427_00985 [Pirellulales bacterium]|nr:hypothetical protein [Pirellulales bacterium]
MLRFFQNLLGAKSKQPKRKCQRTNRSQRRILSLEGLENRNLMAANFAASTAAASTTLQFLPPAPKQVTVSLQNHDLIIRGTNGPDDVKVGSKDGKIVVTVHTIVNGRGVSTSSTWRPSGGDIFFYGNQGNDKFSSAMSSGNYLLVTADGGAGNDQLKGSWGKDNLKGADGDDTLYGNGGHDVLQGGTGADTIYGGDGNDTIEVGADYAPNYANGGDGNDTISGGYGIDTLLGGDGNDELFGSYGDDSLNGGDGNDNLYGGAGNDYLYGGDGQDYLYGDVGNDDLDGGAYEESDHVWGGEGYDRFRKDLTVHHWYSADYDPPGPGGWNYLEDLEPGEEVYS